MTDATPHCMAKDRQALQARLSGFLDGQFDDNKPCRLAREIGCDPRTARNLLLGCWPNAATFQAIVRRWGRDLIEAVFAPEIEPVLARLFEQERRLAEQIEALRAHRRAVEGVPPGVATPDRAAGGG